MMKQVIIEQAAIIISENQAQPAPSSFVKDEHSPAVTGKLCATWIKDEDSKLRCVWTKKYI